MTPHAERPLGWAGSSALLGGMVAAGAVAVRLAPDDRAVVTFWPAAGLGLVLLALAPWRRWLVLVPLMALATTAGDLLGQRSPSIAGAHGLIEAVALTSAALLVTRGGSRRPRLHDQEDFVRLFGAALLSGGLLVVGAAAASWLATYEPVGPAMASAFTAHVAAVLLVFPLAVVRDNHWSGRRPERLVQVLLLAAGSVVTFVPGASSTLTFAPILFLAWAALRFDLRVACAELSLVGIFVTAQTVAGTGPFGDAVKSDQVSALAGGALSQGYLACAALLVLPLGIAVQRNTLLLDRITADGKLFRRNFTESLVGMAFLEPDRTGRDLVVVDLNETALGILGGREESVLGLRLSDLMDTGPDFAEVLPRLIGGQIDGWRVEGPLTFSRTGRVTLQISSLGDAGDVPFFAAQLLDVTAEHDARGLVNHLMEASLTTAIVGIDTAGRISVANSGISHLLGYERDELVGEPFHRLLEATELLERTGADTLDQAFDTLVRGLGRDGETRARDWTWLTRAGGARLVSMTLSVAQDALAARSGYLCVARDVTEQRHSQEMLIAALDKERTAVERLRSLDEAKNEFVSTVSHELRTPVTSIVGYTEMMTDGSVVAPLPEQVPLLQTINRNGQRLISMINDLLMLSGLDADTVLWRQDPVDLAGTIAPVEEAIRPLLHGRDLRFEVSRPGHPVHVLGDRAQLERVMTNLLSNAVKFTEDGGSIGLALDVVDDDAVITVRDSGIGIPTEEQGDLFQRFFRSSTAQVRQIQGTGLGLSIVSAIVSGHGGTIEVESGHLEGSTFVVRLPLAQAERLSHAG